MEAKKGFCHNVGCIAIIGANAGKAATHSWGVRFGVFVDMDGCTREISEMKLTHKIKDKFIANNHPFVLLQLSLIGKA